MLIYKKWQVKTRGGLITEFWDGWYLFGFIPLYLRCNKSKA